MDETQSTSMNAPPTELLGALLSNPDLLRRVGSILGSMQTEVPASAADQSKVSEDTSPQVVSQASVQTPPLTAPAGGTVTSDGLSSLLSDPAFMEKLPSMIATLKPLLNTVTPPPSGKSSASPAECRDHLLLALKPFLSSERREAIDQILRLAKLGTVFKQLK